MLINLLFCVSLHTLYRVGSCFTVPHIQLQIDLHSVLQYYPILQVQNNIDILAGLLLTLLYPIQISYDSLIVYSMCLSTSPYSSTYPPLCTTMTHNLPYTIRYCTSTHCTLHFVQQPDLSTPHPFLPILLMKGFNLLLIHYQLPCHEWQQYFTSPVEYLCQGKHSGETRFSIPRPVPMDGVQDALNKYFETEVKTALMVVIIGKVSN